ncbi:MAG: hypothetical protein Q8P61_04480 [Candidatus Nanopelagicales bacterium]|nr:hypothetical protein [Candidatus Nanopelagicales bacterium]
MKKSGNAGVVAVIFGIALGSALLVGGVVGWVWNIVKLAEMGVDPLTAMFVIRAIGIFVAPLGAVLGFL